MNIFTSSREGTPLQEGEREYIEGEIQRLKAITPEDICSTVASAREYLPGWDYGIEALCIAHDLHFMNLTLSTNIVTMR